MILPVTHLEVCNRTPVVVVFKCIHRRLHATVQKNCGVDCSLTVVPQGTIGSSLSRYSAIWDYPNGHIIP